MIKTNRLKKGVHNEAEFSEDGHMLVTITAADDDSSGLVQIWDKNGTLQNKIETQIINQIEASFKISPDQSILGIQVDRKTIEIWDIKSVQLQKRLSFGGDIPLDSWKFSFDSQRFAAGSFDETIQLWNRKNNSVIVLRNHNSTVRSLMFSSDNSLLASQGDDRLIMYQLAGLDNWEDVINKSCDWLEEYLQSSQDQENTEAKQLCDRHNPDD